MTRLVSSLLLIGACAPDVGSVSFDPPDVAAFQQMQPFLEGRCATLDCHGDEGRPMRLYSETGLRMPGVDRDLPFTPEELQANAFSFLAVDPGVSADRHLSFLKPLAESEGGMEHVGEDVFLPDDDEARCVRGWLARETDASWTSSCEAASARWGPPAE